ncbi:N-acetyltransferase [Aquaticitalea lipolytica]|uniref:N-acetyltransferase n=1 Tax=Aquaticitalea lipolytica TaxID=1247562 RepID=A0A8J2TQU4_9FLAO|nr:GNAT family N-acetyltransferase [Aquaticitalea lipolytica]GFZ83174.1 N-acetyltransferase [Aquaticitalea lipolytica]
MGNVNISYNIFEGDLSNNLFTELLHLYNQLFEDADLEFFKTRFTTQANICSVLAFKKTQLIGFKIGYPIENNTFYSWIGGVNSEFRNIGIGKQLATLQENYAIQKGFSVLKTKSMNRFKPMMILNLKNGFNITKVYTNTKGQTKIVFEKQLKQL